MPNITFNPSLSVIPNALLNKPETNPPFYAEQMPNFNIPSFEPPIRNQPININKKLPPIPIPGDIITGNGENIKPYQPIPQDDVSKPKELFIGNETIKTKHDLHKEQMKQIIPITPPTTLGIIPSPRITSDTPEPTPPPIIDDITPSEVNEPKPPVNAASPTVVKPPDNAPVVIIPAI